MFKCVSPTSAYLFDVQPLYVHNFRSRLRNRMVSHFLHDRTQKLELVHCVASLDGIRVWNTIDGRQRHP